MVTGKRRGRIGAQITDGTNQLSSDLTVEQGGNNDGMDPHRLIEAALTACTIMTLQMYANLKKIDLKEINVTTKIDKEGPESLILRDIALVGELTDEQRKRLIQIADKCPIHQLLTSHIKIETKSI